MAEAKVAAAGERTVILPAVKIRRPAMPKLHGVLEARPRWMQKAAGIVHAAGGWRQITFSFGLAFCLGGIGHVWHCGVMLFIGGLLVGLALRVPWLR